MEDQLSKRLSQIAASKRGKEPGEWVTMSLLERRGKPGDIVVSETEGTDFAQVVHSKKQAGQPSSNSGYAVGPIFGQNLEDQL